MRKHFCRIAACWLLIVLVGRAGVAQGIGDMVRARQPVDLKVEDKVVASVAAGDELTVRKLSDKWLWVQTASGQRGWVLKEAVSLTHETTEPPARFPESSTAPPAAPASANNPFLPAIGVLAGQNIYTTYLYIGAIADGFDAMTYKAEEVQQLMTDVSSMSNVVTENLRQVQAMNLGADDQQAIDNVIDVLADLSREAEALAKYTQTRSEGDLKAFNDARTTAWSRVREVLQLE